MISVDRFTKSAQEVAQRAAEIMQRYSHHQIDTEHQLLALIEQPQGGISQLLEFLKVDANALLKGWIPPPAPAPKAISLRSDRDRQRSPRVVRTIDLAIESHRLKDELISNEHIFLAI